MKTMKVLILALFCSVVLAEEQDKFDVKYINHYNSWEKAVISDYQIHELIPCKLNNDKKVQNDEIVLTKYFSNGEIAKLQKTTTTFVRTREGSSSKLLKNDHLITATYVKHKYQLMLSSKPSFEWAIEHSYPELNHDIYDEQCFRMHNIISCKDLVIILYSYNASIYYETVHKNTNECNKAEITMEFPGLNFTVKNANIFQNDSGLYANIVFTNDRHDLWLISNLNDPIIIWTNGPSRKGREPELRQDYYNKLVREEYEKKLAEKAAKEKINNANNRTNVKDSTENKNDNDDHKEKVNSKATNNDWDSKNAVRAESNAVDIENGTSNKNVAGSILKSSANNDDYANSDSALTDNDSNKYNANPANSDKTNISDGTNLFTYISISAGSIILLTLLFLVLFRKRKI